MKQNLNRATTADLATTLDAEAPNMIESMSTADHCEAAAASVEKRRPVFGGGWSPAAPTVWPWRRIRSGSTRPAHRSRG